MADLVVQQPHLGAESIAILHRLVASDSEGLPQDDIEPYLLVRLIRCGYIRRRTPEATEFVATPAGITRSRHEALVARRRQEERERREIIRGRVQAMIDRMELDGPLAQPVPSLRDLPGYRALPMLRELQAPAVGRRSLPAPRSSEPRLAPEEALRLIRAADQRAKLDSELPVIQFDALPSARGDDLPVEHVGRLPVRRDAAPVGAIIPVAAETADLSSVPVVEIEDVPDEADAETFAATSDGRGRSWGRAAVAVGVAAVVIMAGDAAYRGWISAPELLPVRVHATLSSSLTPATPLRLVADRATPAAQSSTEHHHPRDADPRPPMDTAELHRAVPALATVVAPNVRAENQKSARAVPQWLAEPRHVTKPATPLERHPVAVAAYGSAGAASAPAEPSRPAAAVVATAMPPAAVTRLAVDDATAAARTAMPDHPDSPAPAAKPASPATPTAAAQATVGAAMASEPAAAPNNSTEAGQTAQSKPVTAAPAAVAPTVLPVASPVATQPFAVANINSASAAPATHVEPDTLRTAASLPAAGARDDATMFAANTAAPLHPHNALAAAVRHKARHAAPETAPPVPPVLYVREDTTDHLNELSLVAARHGRTFRPLRLTPPPAETHQPPAAFLP